MAKPSIHLYGSTSFLANHTDKIADFITTKHSFRDNSKPPAQYIDDVIEANEAVFGVVISLGHLMPKTFLEQSYEDFQDSMRVNLYLPILIAEKYLETYDNIRIIIIGSESGTKGSHDTSYFLAKASLVAYVREKQVLQNQQILLVSPSTIEDSPMTKRRTDSARVEDIRKAHPKRRLLHSEEVVTFIYELFRQTTYLTNLEIQMNGGKFARMR